MKKDYYPYDNSPSFCYWWEDKEEGKKGKDITEELIEEEVPVPSLEEEEEEVIQLTEEEVMEALRKWDITVTGRLHIEEEDIPRVTKYLNKILREKQE